MKRFLLLVAGVFIFIGCTNIKPGYVGLAVHLYGNKKGQIDLLKTGRYLQMISVDYYTFPVFNQNHIYDGDNRFYFSSEGLVIGIDIGVQYRLQEDKVKDIFSTYRKGVDELTSVVIKNVIRDYLNQFSSGFSIDDLMEGGVAKLVKKVEEYSREYFSQRGIEIISLSMTSAPYYPESIIKSIEEKNAATQKAIQKENELREAKAALEIARVNAQTNMVMSQTITPMLLKKMAIEKWDGKLPQVTGDGAVPFVDINK